MENSLQEFFKSIKAVQAAYEIENPYNPSVSQFEGDEQQGEEEVQQMQNLIRQEMSGKRKEKNQQWISLAPITTQGDQPSIKSVLVGKEAIWIADIVVERFFYDACIPTNVVNSFYFKPILDVIVAVVLGYKGPTYYQLRINLLKKSKKEVQLLVDSYREIWTKVGCIIMNDGWIDNRQRTLINFLVYYP